MYVCVCAFDLPTIVHHLCVRLRVRVVRNYGTQRVVNRSLRPVYMHTCVACTMVHTHVCAYTQNTHTPEYVYVRWAGTACVCSYTAVVHTRASRKVRVFLTTG